MNDVPKPRVVEGPSTMLVIEASRIEWQRLFEQIRDALRESEVARVRVPRVWIQSPLREAGESDPYSSTLREAGGPAPDSSAPVPASDSIAPPPASREPEDPSASAPATRKPDEIGELSSRALRLVKLVRENPGLKRGKAMQKLALRAADFDRVLDELGSRVVCVKFPSTSGRGRPSQRIWCRGSEIPLHQAPLAMDLRERLSRDPMEDLPEPAVAAVESELQALGEECVPFVFVLERGRVVVLNDKVVWREWETEAEVDCGS